jgi:nicotinic acid phosphoribosyltransferase
MAHARLMYFEAEDNDKAIAEYAEKLSNKLYQKLTDENATNEKIGKHARLYVMQTTG